MAHKTPNQEYTPENSRLEEREEILFDLKKKKKGSGYLVAKRIVL